MDQLLTGLTLSIQFLKTIQCVCYSVKLFQFIDSKGKASRKRGTKLSAIQMLEKKYERKSDLKERQLQLKAEELELQRRKFDAEADERKEKLNLEIEERRMFLNFLKDRL